MVKYIPARRLIAGFERTLLARAIAPDLCAPVAGALMRIVRTMRHAAAGPMESAGAARRCGQPVDRPHSPSFNNNRCKNAPVPSSVPACPQPPHNPFGQVRSAQATLYPTENACGQPTTLCLSHGGLLHSPSTSPNKNNPTALSTGLIVAMNEIRKPIRKTRLANYTPA